MMLTRRLVPFLGLILTVVWVVGVQATEREQLVSFRTHSALVPFQPGQSQRFQVEMAVRHSHKVDNIMLAGSGWTISPVEQTPLEALAEADVFRLEFDLSTDDASRPLVFSYELDGQRVQRKLDLSAKKLAGSLNLENVKVGRESDFPQFAGKAVPGPRPEPQPVDPRWLADPEESGASPDSATPTRAKQARFINVTGRFAYMREGVSVPAYGATVFVLANTWGLGLYTPIGSTTVEYDGSFSVDAAWFYDPFKPNIYVLFTAGNGVVTTIDDDWVYPDGYGWRSMVHTEVSGSELDMGLMYADGWTTPALHMMGSVVRAWAWLNRVAVYQNMPHVDIEWPTGDDHSNYTNNVFDDEGVIHITDGASWVENTHIHEYGHHYVHTYATAVDPEYCNDFCDAGGCPHIQWCPENTNVAFSEGFPTWLSDAVTSDWVGTYGFEPLYVTKIEKIKRCIECGPSFYADPWNTEGYFSALLHDMVDATNEADSTSPGFRDRLNVEPWDILEVVDYDKPVSPGQFISDFLARHHDIRHEFWETCQNNGFQLIDSEPPSTGLLYCLDHEIFVPSTDNSVVIQWNPVYDNFSGVGGYSYTVRENFPEVPDHTVDVSRNRTFIPETLSPGVWYFAVKAVDREGNWDPGYETYGPVIIREPDPGDLRPQPRNAGWDLPLVPKDTQDATPSSVPVDTSPLFSNTYWNASLTNYGEVAVPAANAQIRIDGVQETSFPFYSLDGGYNFYLIDQGPISVPGGRHTFELFVDSSETVPEPDETDNRYGHQWIWIPEVLAPGMVHTRGAPPLRDGGYGSVTDQLRWYNCTGITMFTPAGSTPSPWALLSAYTVSNADDVDVQLHDAPTGAEAGFDFPLCYSGRPEGYVDAVIINAANRPAMSYAAGILNIHPYGMGSDFRAQMEYGEPLTQGVEFAGALESNEAVALFTFDVASAGPMSIELQLDIINDAPPVYAAWFDQSFTVGELLDYDAVAVTDFTGSLRLDITPQTGTHGLLLWRDQIEMGLGRRPYTLKVGPMAPDLAYHQPAGWDAPVIPAPDPTVTPTSGPEPTVLLGETASTYLNLSIRNISATASPSYRVASQIDGVQAQEAYLEGLAAGDSTSFIPTTPVTVRGGRHLVAMIADNRQDLVELDEANNSWASQYVWRPASPWFNTVSWRDAPPDRTADWDRVQTTEPLWFNCDGVGAPTFLAIGDNNRWAAMAIMPGEFSDIDLRLHLPRTSVRDGFDDPLVSSTWIRGESDFTLMNFRNTAKRQFEAGMVLGEGSKNEQYSFMSTTSDFIGHNPDGVIGTYTMAADDILDLYEANFSVPRNYRVTLEINEPALDLGFSLYGPDETYYGKSDVTGANCAAWLQPAGVDESFTFSIDAGQTGYHCLAVWKVGTLDGPVSGSYTLRIEEDQQLPDVTFHQPVGWDAPLVPRPSADATTSWAPLPGALAGDMTVTYFNYSFVSDLDATDPGACELRVLVDDVSTVTEMYPGGAAGTTYQHLGTTPYPMSAGRHSLAYVVDYSDDLVELDETNNLYGAQYVWTPMIAQLDTPDLRTQPREATAGWQYIVDGSELWYNADGVRPQAFDPVSTGNFYGCVAILAENQADVDLRLHYPSLGLTDGFEDPYISSNWPPGHSDFVLMNFNVNPLHQFDAGIISAAYAGEEIKFVASESQYIGQDRVGGLGNHWMEADALVKLYEIEYTSPGGTYRVDLIPILDSFDLGLSLYGPSTPYYAKSDVYDDGVHGPAISYLAPAQDTESITFTVGEEGAYAIAVWKVSPADRDDAMIFGLEIFDADISGVENDGPPAVTRLVSSYPNPFNPMTTVAFDLDSPRDVRLEIFDLRGRLVRVLTEERLPAGRHERVWRGFDALNRNVASGVYMIRLTAGDTVDLRRVSLLK